jgi:hypothetical protein
LDREPVAEAELAAELEGRKGTEVMGRELGDGVSTCAGEGGGRSAGASRKESITWRGGYEHKSSMAAMGRTIDRM